MLRWFVGGFVFACIGLVLVVDPAQFLVNNEVMSGKVNSSRLFKRIFKLLGGVLLILGILFIAYGYYK